MSTNILIQPFAAAVLTGVIGGLAVHYNLSSSLRLVAVCPCMLLVPGPHLLNGATDLIFGRIHLGAACLVYRPHRSEARDRPFRRPANRR
jgi:uncharacterized membrane protein YjjP (DUF1212 family)